MPASLPDAFVAEFGSIYPALTSPLIDTIFSAKSHQCFRVNPIKASPQEIDTILQFSDDVILVPFLGKTTFFVPSQSVKKFENFITAGQIVAQSLSSQLPVILMRPSSIDKILDLCAAPGSKSAQIIAMTEDTSRLICNDIDSKRLFKLGAFLDHLGIASVQTKKGDGRSLWKDFPQYFDKVLVDVPCSMEGRFVKGDETTFSHWSRKKVKNLAKLQRFLLYSAFSATKIGGRFVYSTCTLSREENEDVVMWLLEKLTGKVALIDTTSLKHSVNEFLCDHLDMRSTPSPVHDGVSREESDPYLSTQLRKCLRIFPTNFTEGFFVAVFEKLA